MISTNFINECKNRANANRLGQIVVDGIDTPISQSDNLQSFEIDSGCYVDGNIIGSVYSKCLKAKFVAIQSNLNDKSIYAKIGVKYADLNNEYINVGKYRVERPNNEITANMSQITAYSDLYTNLDSKYVCNINYSTGDKTLSDLYADVCTNLGLTPKSLEFINSTIPIVANPFTNGEKNRTVLQTIAKISCSFVDIDNDTNEIDLCWLSQNEEPDYIFYKSDYSSVEGGEVICGPINCLIIKNSQIDDENVTIKDEESIKLNGEHSITISDDYILHNAELRQQAIDSIWSRVKGMKYVDCKLTTYYGKPFLKLGNKIRIYISDTEYFDTYVLKHNFTYDGTFSSVIQSPALTEQEIKNKQDISLAEALANVQIDVNKQEKQITALIETNSLTQTKTGVNYVETENSYENGLTKLKFYGDIHYLFPSEEQLGQQSSKCGISKSGVSKAQSFIENTEGLYPSEDLYLVDSYLIIEGEGETKKIQLPYFELNYTENIYDEFILEKDHAYIIRRLDENKHPLANESIEEIEKFNIQLYKGYNKIYMESFNLNYEVTYNIQNAYTDAFATKTELRLAEEEINMKVSKKTNSDEIISSINLSPEKVKIQSGKLDVDAIAEFTNSKLKDKGSTIINGSNITTGDIDATKVNVVNLNADNIKSGNIQSKNYVSNTSGTKINLENGTIDTKNFKVDDSGNVNVKGIIEGSTIKGSYFTGTTENIKLQIGTDNNGYMSNNNSLELVYSSDNTRILGIYGKFWNVSNQKACYFSSQASRFVFVGDVFANNISNSSRATLKKNFEKFNNGLDIVKNTDIYKYHFKTQNDKEKKHIGIVIGNKYRYKKEITTQNNDGIDLYSMIAVAYKAIQEQQQMIDDLKHEIEVLKDEK
jgi:hypothetical protein|nr:MAG TPA: hypothetical protein [Caudoviricetes sp.]